MPQNSKLKIFAIIGCPIGHTLSPYMHMAAFSKSNIKAIYIPFSIEPKKIKETISLLKKSCIDGFNVTIPFKSACMKYLDKIDKLASMIGAVNTIAIKNNKFIGYNTDATGFLKSLKEDLELIPKNKTCMVLGAGGAAKAVCFALAKQGAREILITDVVKGKAVSLAKNLKKYFPKCNTIAVTQYSILNTQYSIDLLVNATPLGMKKQDPLPINPKFLHKGLRVYDLVYNLPATKLINLARQKGIKAVNGLGMLLYQGAEAFRLWTNKKPPVGAMKKALEEEMKTKR